MTANNEIKIYDRLDSSPKYVKQSVFSGADDKDFILNIRATTSELKLISKLKDNAVLLGSLCSELIFGVVITRNIAEVVSRKEKEKYKPFLEGKDITRYFIRPVGKYLDYNPRLLHRARKPRIFEIREKLLIQRITGGKKPLKVAYDDKQYYNKESINNLLLKDDTSYDIKYILGLMNSKLINWFYRKRYTNESDLTVNISKKYLSQIPVHKIDFNDKICKACHDRLVRLADQMLDLNKKLSNAEMANEREDLKNQIDATDRQIDQLVYELYGLTDEEIKIVEGAD